MVFPHMPTHLQATAKYNSHHQAADGLPTDIFPPDLPIYTGHYHLPQVVAETHITYVGSPYQGEEGGGRGQGRGEGGGAGSGEARGAKRGGRDGGGSTWAVCGLVTHSVTCSRSPGR